MICKQKSITWRQPIINYCVFVCYCHKLLSFLFHMLKIYFKYILQVKLWWLQVILKHKHCNLQLYHVADNRINRHDIALYGHMSWRYVDINIGYLRRWYVRVWFIIWNILCQHVWKRCRLMNSRHCWHWCPLHTIINLGTWDGMTGHLAKDFPVLWIGLFGHVT